MRRTKGPFLVNMHLCTLLFHFLLLLLLHPSPPATPVTHMGYRLACCLSDEWPINTSGPKLLSTTLDTQPPSAPSWQCIFPASCSWCCFSFRSREWMGTFLRSKEVSNQRHSFAILCQASLLGWNDIAQSVMFGSCARGSLNIIPEAKTFCSLPC